MRPSFIPTRRRPHWFGTTLALALATAIVFGAIYAASALIAMEMRPMSWQAARCAGRQHLHRLALDRRC